MASSPAAIAATRSLSLTRNSPTPFMMVVPLAAAAAMLRIGYSSIMEGARSAGTSTPFKGPERTAISATGSPPTSRTFS